MEYSNQELVKHSLAGQIANMALQMAEKDSIIAEQSAELEPLRKQQIAEMDEAE